MLANVYNTHGLVTADRTAIYDGIKIVAANMAMHVEISELRVSLPQEHDGRIDANRIGFVALDPDIDLHVFALPARFKSSTPQNKTLGVSGMSSGVSIIDIADPDSDRFRVAAHEVAHSFGLYPSNSTKDGIHCSITECILYPYQTTQTEIHEIIEKRSKGRVRDFLFGYEEVLTRTTTVQTHQTDFCEDCKSGLYLNAEDLLKKMHQIRRVSGMPRALKLL